MIDIHIHILHGLDDGPSTLADAVALAQAAVAAGTETVVATPHIRDDYPFALEEIDTRASELRAALRDANVPLELATGGEVSLAKSVDMSDADLRRVALRDGPYLLVESPYGPATDMLEQTLFDLQARGFRPVLAHPERSPTFQSDLDRFAALIDRGALASITAASLAGQFGRTPRRTALAMVEQGLVHDVASDAHDTRRRLPDLVPGLGALGGNRRRPDPLADWYTREAPAAMLAGRRLPPWPAMPSRRGSLMQIFGRSR